MTTLASIIAILAAAVIFVVGVVVLGVGAWMWTRALAEVQRARVHRISADTQEETLESGREALDEIDERRRRNREPVEERAFPSDHDFYRQILDERPPEQDVTTTGNEGAEYLGQDSGITPDRIYVPEEEAYAE